MAVSPAIAAALAAKYPHLTVEDAVRAVPLDAQEQVRMVAGEPVTVSRYRKYRLPAGQIVVLNEPEAPSALQEKFNEAVKDAVSKGQFTYTEVLGPKTEPAPKAEKHEGKAHKGDK